MRFSTRVPGASARLALVVAALNGAFAYASGSSVAFVFEGESAWVSSASGYEGAVRVVGVDSVSRVDIGYTYPGDAKKFVVAERDKSDALTFRFRLPAISEFVPGFLTYSAEATVGAQTADILRSETRTVPLALEKELDITGDAAVALLYPLGGPEYTVRYVPCCNIFGGVTIATRVPVNPESASAGLPEKRLSDFIVLKPDGLSASTMGMYFDFLLGPERFAGVTPILLEFDGSKWVEFKTYEVDLAKGRISMHCPNGGTFVVAAKP